LSSASKLWRANTGRVTEIARAEIVNDGAGTDAIGHYDVRMLRGARAPEFEQGRAQRKGKVHNYRRTRLHVWNLVALSLLAMDFGRR
jgi:hypothetical protein